jgi:hypothetical protein
LLIIFGYLQLLGQATALESECKNLLEQDERMPRHASTGYVGREVDELSLLLLYFQRRQRQLWGLYVALREVHAHQ